MTFHDYFNIRIQSFSLLYKNLNYDQTQYLAKCRLELYMIDF